MLPRRGTKRARSSSPTSSPAAEKAALPRSNVKKLTNALKSPHADPTLELWDRFSLSVNANQATTPGLAANPALADLMVSSSPRPSKAMQSRRGESGLRRAASCGVNVPKRRRLEKSTSGSQSSRGQRDLEAASKSSLVTALLDTVTSSMQDLSQGEISTPTQGLPRPKKDEAQPQISRSGGDGFTSNSVEPKPKPGDSSDYGDDDFDFDDDTFMELEASLDVPPSSKKETPLPSSKPSATTATKQIQTEENEFDELGDELFEDLDASADHNNSTFTKKESNKSTSKPQDLEDEFDDDFAADIDFEAVEFAATQSVQQKQTDNGGTKVRSVFPV